VYLEQPAEIAQVVLDWTSSQPGRLAELAHHAAKLAYPGAAYRIANHVYELI
jgi:UDP-N-acetylglucosamine:LPS N-acetylglucosamine transferase